MSSSSNPGRPAAIFQVFRASASFDCQVASASPASRLSSQRVRSCHSSASGKNAMRPWRSFRSRSRREERRIASWWFFAIAARGCAGFSGSSPESWAAGESARSFAVAPPESSGTDPARRRALTEIPTRARALRIGRRERVIGSSPGGAVSAGQARVLAPSSPESTGASNSVSMRRLGGFPALGGTPQYHPPSRIFRGAPSLPDEGRRLMTERG